MSESSKSYFISNSRHGQVAHGELEILLERCRANQDIRYIIANYRAGNPEFGNSKQFYAPYLIEFSNNSRWIIYSTTSLRTDRVKGQQWDAQHLKELGLWIEKALLVYPDATPLEEIRKFKAQREKYVSGYEISYIDDIISHQMLGEAIRKEAQRLYEENYDRDWSLIEKSIFQKGMEDAAQSEKFGTLAGRSWDRQGHLFETEIAAILSHKGNLRRWRGEMQRGGLGYAYFQEIMTAFGFKHSDDIREIYATSDKAEIKMLPGGGSPKTDVIVRFITKSGDILTRTASCKRTKRGKVSVHQYTADAFAEILDPQNDRLHELLQLFQISGTLEKMPSEACMALENELAPHLEKLGLWVLGGNGGAILNREQIAEYLVTYRTDSKLFTVHKVLDYFKLICEKGQGMFGTPFSWTFASGCRGKSIQLKMPVL